MTIMAGFHTGSSDNGPGENLSPLFLKQSLKSNLEVKLQRKLNDPGIAGSQNLTESG